jgi:hypothetical protein
LPVGCDCQCADGEGGEECSHGWIVCCGSRRRMP